MVHLQIRKCTADDQTAVIDVWVAAGLTKPWNDPAADFSRAIKGPQSTVLAGTFDGKVIACVMVGEDGHRGWIYYLGVRPEHQGKGLGSRMLQAAEDWLQARDVEKVNLLVRTSNGPVREFYRNVGYHRSDVICMQKNLTD